MNLSNYSEEAILNHFFRGISMPSIPNVYVGLFVSDPTDANTGTEVNGAGYTRQKVTFGSPTQANGKAVITNNAKIDFPIAQGPWNTVTHIGYFDSLSGGNLLVHAPISVSKQINTNDQPTINVNTLTIEIG